jgi:hypothetical protein
MEGKHWAITFCTIAICITTYWIISDIRKPVLTNATAQKIWVISQNRNTMSSEALSKLISEALQQDSLYRRSHD